MRHRLAAALLSLTLAAPLAAADYSLFELEGRIATSAEFFLGLPPFAKRVGCALQVDTLKPPSPPPAPAAPPRMVRHLVIIFAADGTPCASIYPAGRRMRALGSLGSGYLEGYWFWISRW